MNTTKFGAALAGISALLLATTEVAAQRDVHARVTGKGAALPGVTITLRLRGGDATLQARTDSTGRAVFLAVPTGTYDATTEALGFRASSKTISVDDRAPDTITFELEPAPLPVPGVTVKGEGRVPGLDRTGFYERKQKERGEFLDRVDIENRPSGRRISDFMHGLPGVIVRQGPGNQPYVYMRGNEMSLVPSRGMCGPTVYVNGTVAHQGNNQGPALIDELASIDNVAGIEVYRSAARLPAQFGGAMSACGVILIWLRTGG